MPEDIHEDTYPFESGCVAIDWQEHLEETLAGHVVFLIDACREGIEQESMGLAGVQHWGEQKVGAALRRKVARVYACSPGQLALFVRPRDTLVDPVPGIGPGESFSLFSRSVADVIAARPQAQFDLAAFKREVQDRMTLLHRAYRKRGPSQTLRIDTDIDREEFLFLPARRSSMPRPPRPVTANRPGSATRSEPTAMGVGAPAPTVVTRGVRDAPVPGSRRPGLPKEPAAPRTSAGAGGASGPRLRVPGRKLTERERVLRDAKRSGRELDRLMRGGRRYAWARIGLLVVTVSALIAGTGYALWDSRADADDRGAQADDSRSASRSASGSSSTNSSPSVRTSDAARTGSQETAPSPPPATVPDVGYQSANEPDVMNLPRCTTTGSSGPVTAQLRSQRNSYGLTDGPVLVFTVKSTSECRINVTPRLVRLTLASAGDEQPLWDSAGCAAKTPDRWIAVSPDSAATVTYRWNRRRATSCTETTRAPAGTYLATGTLSALSSLRVQTSFVLEDD
ncbi:hypothetical protein ABZ192_41760 [Streptomyces sp. NPDC006235]|uniref:hypothetical protein n=1 Tax=Streptomyces sp. NPDC006235 TaxID=3156736 RepID=UPI0033A27944